MPYGFLDIAMTPSVVAAQEAMGADGIWKDFRGNRAFDRFTEDERNFIEARDSFYMASVSETGWPYVQHRGGAPGFLKVLDDRTLAFADYRGNRQYLSVGNVAADGRCALILVDYPRRARLKILAVAEVVRVPDRELARSVAMPEYKAVVERVFRLRLQAFDWNCPQHITPRFTRAEVETSVEPLRERITQLEMENITLRSRLADQGE